MINDDLSAIERYSDFEIALRLYYLHQATSASETNLRPGSQQNA
jgi:hypothetical protein